MNIAGTKRSWLWLLPLALSISEQGSQGADLVALAPQTWDRYVPQGKEVDAIYGDFAIANDQIMAVIAHPKRGRNANMTVREVGGCLIDLTTRDRQSDQLSAYYPGAQLRDLRFGGIEVQSPKVYETEELDRVFVQGKRVVLRLVATPKEKEPDLDVSYTLEDGWPYVLITTTFTQRNDGTAEAALIDSIRADTSFQFQTEPSADLFWAYDEHFGQAYGVVSEGHSMTGTNARRVMLRFAEPKGRVSIPLKNGESYQLQRKIVPAANLFALHSTVDQIAGKAAHPVELTVKDTAGKPVADARISLAHANAFVESWGRTDERGVLRFNTGEGVGTLKIESQAHGSKEVAAAADETKPITIELPEAAVFAAAITSAVGKPTPCKVQFIGKGTTPSPDFGPPSAERGVKNVYYSHDGKFERRLAPGTYDVIVSYGPEYDAVFATVELSRGKTTSFEAKLVRSVKSDGWISTDYHSHSSPSGDNTASQLGRVLNLLCEQVEFAPCTEHNRLSTYDPHLISLGAVEKMATCVGMEMTGQPLPLNHQNAFPLVMKERTQDNGGPQSDQDPATQIERLAGWDGSSEKLVQVNHPDMGWMFRDRNGNGSPDSGFTGMPGHMDVIEVHPIHTIFDPPTSTKEKVTSNNTVVNWLQILNQGKRIPGVVNTDAHYNFHGSGFLRNFVKSPTDDPSLVKTLDIVHASEKGNLVMSSGPFMEVELRSETDPKTVAGPGDDLALKGGKGTLKVRVQCPNWFDVDRVQVFLNGKASKDHNFTREADSNKFMNRGPLKFDQEIGIDLKDDAHLIVVAIGEKSELGMVLGPEHQHDKPVAVSNPIYIDVEGNGFKPNNDPLGDLPVKSGAGN